MRSVAVIAFTLCASLLAAQAEWPKPKWETVEKLRCPVQGEGTVALASYRLRLARAVRDNIHCTADLVDAAGKETELLEGAAISVYEGTGKDVFGDGSPSIILQDFSGGTEPRYTYKIVNLSEPPVVLPAIENEAPFYFFQDTASHSYRIMTTDGGFHNFDGMCFDCSPFPRVVLRADKDGLHDVSADFVEQYNSEIALARAKIGEGGIAKFLEADFRDARNVVLEIVFAYLYSGREAEAWQTLDQMWPAKDRERVKSLIVKTHAEGLLSKLAKTRPR